MRSLTDKIVPSTISFRYLFTNTLNHQKDQWCWRRIIGKYQPYKGSLTLFHVRTFRQCERHYHAKKCSFSHHSAGKLQTDGIRQRNCPLIHIKVTRHLCFKKSKNLQLLDVQACNSANKAAFQNPTKWGWNSYNMRQAAPEDAQKSKNLLYLVSLKARMSWGRRILLFLKHRCLVTLIQYCLQDM